MVNNVGLYPPSNSAVGENDGCPLVEISQAVLVEGVLPYLGIHDRNSMRLVCRSVRDCCDEAERIRGRLLGTYGDLPRLWRAFGVTLPRPMPSGTEARQFLLLVRGLVRRWTDRPSAEDIAWRLSPARLQQLLVDIYDRSCHGS